MEVSGASTSEAPEHAKDPKQSLRCDCQAHVMAQTSDRKSHFQTTIVSFTCHIPLKTWRLPRVQEMEEVPALTSWMCLS